MDKLFNKMYHTPAGSFTTFFLSVISGYPIGAKLISTMYENKYIDQPSAKKLMSFCSLSGPMFMLGTVGIAIFNSYTAGLIILISNILGGLINGLIYRGKKSPIENKTYTSKKSNNILTDSVYDSMQSILMVGGFVVLSFLLIDLLKNTYILSNISGTICSVFHCHNLQPVVESTLCGILEITRGIIDLNTTQTSLSVKTIIASGLIGFGGISIMLQSLSFVSKIKLPIKTVILQKITQSVITTIIAIPLCLIFL